MDDDEESREKPARQASFQVETSRPGSVSSDVERKVGRSLLPVCFLLVSFSFIDRTNLAFASLSMNNDLHISPATYGLASGVFFLGYAICQIPSNMVLVRTGASNWLATISILWGCCAACFALVRTQTEFILLRFLLGVFESGAIPGLWYYLSLFYAPDRLTFPYTVMETGITVSQIVGAPLAAGLLALDGVAGLRGWQWIFVAEGIPTVLLGIYMKFCLPDTPAQAPFLSAQEREELLHSCQQGCSSPSTDDGSHAALGLQGGGDVLGAAAGRAAAAAGKPPFSWPVIRAAVMRWKIWYAGGWRFLHDVAGYGVLFWTPMLVNAMLTSTFQGSPPNGHRPGTPPDSTSPPGPDRALGMAANSTGSVGVLPVLLTAVPFAAASIFHLMNAWHSQRCGERRLHITLPWVAGAAALLALPAGTAAAPVLGFILLNIVHMGVNGANGCQTAWVASLVPHSSVRAVSLSMYNTIGGFGGFLGPYVVGLLSQSSGQYGPAMMVLGGALLAAAVMVLFFPDRGGDIPAMPRYERLGSGLQYERLDSSTRGRQTRAAPAEEL